jgi:diadenosine tetraphosphatase ApaH/serine/threonine PP2A family protein phosphatase
VSFAIVSDIHSNLEALESVFSRIDALGVREVVCLGDVVGYGADPLPVTRLIMQRCKWTILGNHDWGLFHDLDDFNPLAREALYLSRRRLKPSWVLPGRRAAYEFLRRLPERMQDHGCLFFHGSPRDPVMEYVLRSDGFLEPEKMHSIFSAIDRPTFVGHTHWPGIHRGDFKFTQATDENREFDLHGEPCIADGDVVDWHHGWAAVRKRSRFLRIVGLCGSCRAASCCVRTAPARSPAANRQWASVSR